MKSDGGCIDLVMDVVMVGKGVVVVWLMPLASYISSFSLFVLVLDLGF